MPRRLLIFCALLLSVAAANPSPTVPNPVLTPGDVLTSDPAIICVPGYTQTVRDVPQSLKEKVYKLYGISSRAPKEYEVDHLISLQLGGSNSIKNLWPESYITEPLNAHVKDKLETRLHSLACKGKITFLQAQKMIATDWVGAYQKYIGPIPGFKAKTTVADVKPAPFTGKTQKPDAAGNCPKAAPIKGNASSKIYHVPSGALYAKTKAELCFATEKDARAAGYRRSKR